MAAGLLVEIDELPGMLHARPNQQVKTSTRDTRSPDDVALLARIGDSDSEAMEVLYRRYFPRVARFAERMLSSPEVIEEVVNDVMYVIWRKASTFNGQGQVSTWIFGIAYRICLKARGNLPSDAHVPLEEAEDLIPGTADRGLVAFELDDWVGHLFDQLPLEQRAVLELTYHHDLKYGEIAEILGCPENTVKTRVFHARKKIRALMPDANGEAAARLEGTS